MPYPIEPLSQDHDRAAFSCGTSLLDTFLHQRVGQFVDRDLTRAFVMVDPDGTAAAAGKKTIVGYDTLSSSGLDYEEMSDALRHRVPRRMRVGVTLLGYLAVDGRYKGQGRGKDLLYDALYRTLRVSEEVATRAVIVDAVDADAVSFYAHHALRRFADDSNRFFYTMEDMRRLFARTRSGTPL